MQETRLQFLDWDDSLEKVMVTHSSILTCRISQTEESGGIQSMGSQRIRNDCVTNISTFTSKLVSSAKMCQGQGGQWC